MPGSIVLLAGDPGIGKSTLLLQAMAQLAQGMRVLYVSGEESPQQLKLRASRLKIDCPSLFVLSENSLEAVLEAIETKPPLILAVDSIQTIHSGALDVAPGSITQVRECTLRLLQWAKGNNVPVFIAGHVTKSGYIAGPRALEHALEGAG